MTAIALVVWVTAAATAGGCVVGAIYEYRDWKRHR